MLYQFDDQRLSPRAGDFAACLFNWYYKCWWRDGADEIALDEVLFS